MSLKPEPLSPIPEATARLARIVCPKGGVCIWIGDELSAVFQDELFASFFPRRGQPAEAPWRLALVTVLQFVEGLSDRQAAEAVRTRIDWKYALRLELEDLGFDFSVLCEFRARLLQGCGEALLFETLLRYAKEQGWRQQLGAVNAPIPPMCWRPSKRSVVWNVSQRPYAKPSMFSRQPSPSGCKLTSRRNGMNAMLLAGRIIGFRQDDRSAKRWQR
jgi:hypothetical protein